MRLCALDAIFASNVPGIALYLTSLSQVRGFMAVSPLFAVVQKRDPQRYSSILPVLTSSGNLLAGATTRVAVGFVMNPLSVLKARYEVRESPDPFSITILRHSHFYNPHLLPCL
jgi:solute carrier family 25 protein 38